MNFLIRTITAVIYSAILLFCMQKGGAWFFGLFGICTALAAIEFTGLANKYRQADSCRVWSALAATAGYFTMALAWAGMNLNLPLALLLICLLAIFTLQLYLKKESPMKSAAYTLFPILYIALPFALLSALAYRNGQYDCAIPIAIFIMLWCNDVGAYCTGCTIGRHKLFERVSPKKTWEGSAGGAVLTVVGTVILRRCLPEIYSSEPLWFWFGMALTVVVFGTWGDLFESLMKREMGVKDSGKILPGHGGMLDRFDSSLLAVIAVTAYVSIISAVQ